MPRKQKDLAAKARIKELRQQGLKTHEIAALIGKSEAAVTAHERSTPGYVKRPRGHPANPEIAARDTNIYLAFKRGLKAAQIAAEYKITTRHAFVIRNRESEKRKSRLLGRMK